MEDHAKYKEALDAENERKIKEAVDAAVDEAKELISKKKWSEAYNVLAKASGTYSGREELKTAIADLKDKYAAALIKSADKLSKEGKHLNAIEKIDGAYSWLDARKEITDARQKYTDAYIKETIKKAKSAFEAGKDKKDYKKAISVLQTAVNKIGWNEKLNKEIEKYQEYIPVDLTTLEPYHESKWIEFKKDVEDSLGNTYSTGIEACNGDQFMTWDLGGRYTVLTAKGIIERWDRNISTERKPSTLRIYGDDVLLYEKTDIKSTTKPYDIKVDITGVTDLRIETSTPSDMGYNSVEVYLVDVFVQK